MYYDQPTYLDEKTLQAIATTTGGTYFRATDTVTLKAIYTNIDKLEKTKTVLEYSLIFFVIYFIIF